MVDLEPAQEAIIDALNDAPATYPVYDAVPQDVTHPYLALGATTQVPDADLDVDSSDGTITLHAWSKAHGKYEAQRMLQFARERLDGQDIGAGAWACYEEFAEVFEDPSSSAESRLFHGVSRYRVRLN